MKPTGLFYAVFAMLFLVIACVKPHEGTSTTENSLKAELNAIITEYNFPGMTAAIVDGERVQSAAVGFANAEAEQPMTENTKMLAASIGKTFVAATALKLDNEGILDIDDPISNWLSDEPWFGQLPNHNLITIRHLLQHTSGLSDHVHSPAFAEMGLERAAEIGPEGLIALVLNDDPLFAPGESWSYTDTGYLVLGLVIERALDQSYDENVKSTFLESLNLDHTGPSDVTSINGLARGYVSPVSGLGLPPFTTNDEGEMVWDPSVEWTGGGLYSTSLDLARWGQAYLTGDLLGIETLNEMTDRVPASADDPSSYYGLGIAMRLDPNLGEVRGHRGWIPGYVSSLQHYPELGVTVAFQINTDIGIIDADTNVILDVEMRLLEVAVSQ